MWCVSESESVVRAGTAPGLDGNARRGLNPARHLKRGIALTGEPTGDGSLRHLDALGELRLRPSECDESGSENLGSSLQATRHDAAILPIGNGLSIGNAEHLNSPDVLHTYECGAEQDARVATIGERIAATIAELGVTKTALAARAGVSGATITRYIKNERQPKVAELAAIARALQVSLSWLYDGSGPKRFGPSGEPELSIDWPAETPEAVRIAVQQQVLAERDAHRRALIPYWQERMRAILAAQLERARSAD